MNSNTPLPLAGLPDDCVSIPAAAKLLQVDGQTIRFWIYSRRIRAWRVGGRYRVSIGDLATKVTRIDLAKEAS